MVRISLFIISSVLLAVLFFTTGCNIKKTDGQKEAVEPIRIEVKVGKAQKQTLQKTRLFTGVLEPFKQADLTPGMGGRIRKIPVKIGEFVEQGTVLAEMDDATLVTTQTKFETLQSEFQRTKRLYENDVVPQAQFEKIEAEYRATKRQLEQIKENTTITAPFHGIVTDIGAVEGELYSGSIPGMGASSGLIQLSQLDPLKIDIDVDENTVSFLKKEMNVQINVETLPDTTFIGKIQWVNPTAEKISRTFKTRIVIPNRQRLLKAGYFATIEIITAEKKNALAIPLDGLVENKVFTIVQDSIAVSRIVETGWRTDTFVEIVSGINQGDIVVVAGNKALPDSSIVIIEE